MLMAACQNKADIKIVSLEIGEQKQIVGDHYDSEMKLCLSEKIGNEGFSFTLFVETKDGRNFECAHDVIVNQFSEINEE